MQSLRMWFVSPSDLTVEAAVPLVVAGILIVASLSVAVRDWRRTGPEFDLRERGPAVALVLGSIGIAISVTMALDQPDSLSAFVVGAVGAIGCYVGVFRSMFVEERGTALDQVVAVTALLWIAGALTVGGVAAADARHYAVGGSFGAVAGVATIGVTILFRERTGSALGTGEPIGGILLTIAFLLPTAVGTIFGEEILFVVYSIAVVLTAILWWFLRLTDPDLLM